MIFSTGMEGGSFVMCEDPCGTPAPSFDGAVGVLVGPTAPGGGGGNGPFCCAPSVAANKPLAIRSSGLAFMRLLPSSAQGASNEYRLIGPPCLSSSQLQVAPARSHFESGDC